MRPVLRLFGWVSCMSKEEKLRYYLDELSDIYGVTHMYVYEDDTYTVIFQDYRFESRGETKKNAKERAYIQAINYLSRQPLPEKPQKEEFKELVKKHGLKPKHSSEGKTAWITLGDLIFEGKGPDKTVAKERAITKALQYLRTLPLQDTASTVDDTKGLQKSTVTPITESVQKMATWENKQATTASNNLGTKDTGKGQTKHAVEDKKLCVNQNGPIEIETAGPLTRPDKQSTESLKGLADNPVRPRRAGNNATEAVLLEPTASRVQSPLEEKATLVKTKIISVTTDHSETHEYMRQCKELQTRGLREAPQNTADISDPNITVVLHKDDIDNNPVGIQKAAQHAPPKKTCVYSIQFRPVIQFPEELKLTSEEKERIVNEAVHDLVHEFQSPQLLREAVLKPEDHKLYDILSEKVAARYNILKEQKQTESPL